MIVKQLTEQDIPQVFELSNNIFGPILQSTQTEDESVWYTNFNKNGLLFGAFVDDSLAGFIFFYEKEKDTGSMHCWMVGVDEQFRKQGILTKLMEVSRGVLRDNGYAQMTINTFPEKFPAIYDYLISNHFEKYNESAKESNGLKTAKYFFRKKL